MSAQVDAIRRLGDISRTYEATVIEYAEQTKSAAIAEADYRRVKAVYVTRACAAGTPVSKAEYAADADDEVSEACMAYKVTAGAAEATRARLRQLQAAIDAGRSYVASDREADRLAASGATP